MPALSIPGFLETLNVRGLVLDRKDPTVCQVNVGLVCNQACKHCHLSAGPGRKEVMTLETMAAVVAFLGRSGFKILDITGGAPELNPNLCDLMEMAGRQGVDLMLRCNLSALHEKGDQRLKDLLVQYQVNVVASLPSLNRSQTDAQRGAGAFETSLSALRELNQLGYGDPASSLKLDLVSNPSGAFMPSPQAATEKRFRKILEDKWGIRFNQLFTFANMPLGRFLQWLERSGNLQGYLERLYKGFNPCTLDSLMCRNLVSVSWDGMVYDCDFNQAAGLPMANRKTHISDLDPGRLPGQPIAVGTHCYACTAGAGFT